MKRKLFLVALLGVFGAALYGGMALATPPAGVTTTVFGVGHFDSIDANTKTATPGTKPRLLGRQDQDEGRFRPLRAAEHDHAGRDLRLAQPPRPQPGHRQVGHGDGLRGRRSRVRAARRPDRSTFVDDGHDTIVRNEGTVDLVTVVVSLIPAGFQRRIDENAPANCPNLPNG